MTVAGEHQFATGAASPAAGSRPYAQSRGAAAARSSDSFGSLLFQDQSDSNENAASATSGAPDSSISGAATTQEAGVKKPRAGLASLIPSEAQASSRRKKGTNDPDPSTTAVVSQTPAMSAAARWLLSLTGGGAGVASSRLSSIPDLEAQSPTNSSGQENAAPVPSQEGKASPDLAIALDPNANPLGGVENAVNGPTPGTVDAVPFAELSLTPTAASASANQATASKSKSPIAISTEASSPIRLRADSDDGSPSQGAKEGSADTEIRLSDVNQGGESSLGQSASRQNAAFAGSKKKAGTGSGEGVDSAVALDRGGSNRGEAASPVSIRPSESQSTRRPAEAAPSASPVLEPNSTEPAKTSGSSVGTIELEVKVADDKSVGLRFVERQGQVTVQLKSGDVQTAQALSDNLAGLKTSLNETGWDVESRLQAGLTPVSQSSQTATSADRGSSPLAQFESSSLSSRDSLDPVSITGNQQARQAADQFGSPQTPRAEQVSTGQMKHQNGSDSSTSQDQGRQDREGSPGRNGQQARHDSAGADSERQGRRSTQDTEAWLESMESNLTGFKSSRFTSGVNK